MVWPVRYTVISTENVCQIRLTVLLLLYSYANGNVNVMLNMTQTDLYQEDWIGLKQLNQQGRLQFLSIPGNHMQFTLEFFAKNVIAPYLTN